MQPGMQLDSKGSKGAKGQEDTGKGGAKGTHSHCWQWNAAPNQNKGKRWRPYRPTARQNLLFDAYNRNPKGSVEIELWEGQKYTVDFTSTPMTQTNHSTGYERAVRLIDQPYESEGDY